MLQTIDIKRQHGGDLDTFRERYGCAPLDFSSNVSPLGVPVQIRQAIAEAAEEVDCYPDPYCRALTERIAAAEGVPQEWVLCGAGAAELPKDGLSSLSRTRRKYASFRSAEP